MPLSKTPSEGTAPPKKLVPKLDFNGLSDKKKSQKSEYHMTTASEGLVLASGGKSGRDHKTSRPSGLHERNKTWGLSNSKSKPKSDRLYKRTNESSEKTLGLSHGRPWNGEKLNQQLNSYFSGAKMFQSGQKDHDSVSKIGINTANSSPNPNKHLLGYLANGGSPGATTKKSTLNTYIKTIIRKGTLDKNATKLTKDNVTLANKLKSIKQKNDTDQAGYRGALSYRGSQYYSGVGHSQTKKPGNQGSNDNSYQFNLSASKKKKSLGESALKSHPERKSSSKSLKRKLGENFVNMSNSNIHHCYQHGQTSRKSSNPQLFSNPVNVSMNAQGQPTKTSGTMKNDTFKKIGFKFEKIFGHKLSEKAFVERTPSRGKFLQQKGKKSARGESEKSRISNDYYHNTSTRKSPGESPYNISRTNRIKVENYHTGRPNTARDHGASGQKIYPSALENSGL